MGPPTAPPTWLGAPASTWNYAVQASRSTLRGGWPHPTEVKADEALENYHCDGVSAYGMAGLAPCRRIAERPEHAARRDGRQHLGDLPAAQPVRRGARAHPLRLRRGSAG